MSGMAGIAGWLAAQPAQQYGGWPMQVQFHVSTPREMRLLAKFCEDLAKLREDEQKEAIAEQQALAERYRSAANGDAQGFNA